MVRIVLAPCWSQWRVFADEWVDLDAAKKWATTIVRKAVSESDHIWEGDLSQVVPLNFTVAGKRFKLKFVGVPEALIADVVMPAFKRLGPVKRLSTEEELAQRRPGSARSRAQAIGDVDKVQFSWKDSWRCEATAEAT